VYNILGDINAAGRIAGPILVKAGATKDEQSSPRHHGSISTVFFHVMLG
jgi:hypothetical protein